MVFKELRARLNQKGNDFNTKNIFMGLVLFMWATSFIIDIINPKYDPPEYINPLIMLVGGFLLAASNASTKDKNGKE